MFSQEVMEMLIKGIGETLYMTLGATIFGYVLGLPMGIIMVTTTAKDGIQSECRRVQSAGRDRQYWTKHPVFDPLLILLMPLTKAIVGKSYGSTATIVPLVISAAPFIARMVESSLNEVDAGVIEAAKSMGASTMQIITKVMLVEARTSLDCGGDDHPGYSAWVTQRWPVPSAAVVLVILRYVMAITDTRQIS